MEPRISLEAVRDALPTLDGAVYLNTGGAGPLPMVVARAIERALAGSLARCRASLSAYDAMTARHEGMRLRLAALLAAHPDEIALSTGSSAGMNTFVWSIDWKPGDEVVTTSLEHPGLMAPLHVAAQRHGVRLHVLPLTSGGEDLEARVRALTNARTRLVALSHVSYATGARLDVEGAARAARDAGALVLVDGAQGAGSVPTDPRAMGADGYALSGQKWLLGPDSTGCLYVRPELVEVLRVTFPSWLSWKRGTYEFAPGAVRFEPGWIPTASLEGLLSSLEFAEEAGDGRFARACAMAERCLELVAERTRVVTPPGQATLVTFSPEEDATELVARLGAAGVVIRDLPGLGWARASVGFWTSDEDLERLAAGI